MQKLFDKNDFETVVRMTCPFREIDISADSRFIIDSLPENESLVPIETRTLGNRYSVTAPTSEDTVFRRLLLNTGKDVLVSLICQNVERLNAEIWAKGSLELPIEQKRFEITAGRFY
ncbi:MAG: hypothetical protein J6P44_01780 [Bacteroidales bacterium]|nr:hypothetical protein [Bacteroidales bacterium]